jgi:hypothetical protein
MARTALAAYDVRRKKAYGTPGRMEDVDDGKF